MAPHDALGPRPSGAPPEAWKPLVRAKRAAIRPLERFLGVEAASGIVLLVAAGLAMLLANSAWAHAYASVWHTPIGIRLGAFRFERSLEWVVNDGLMVIFFFVVGMEIRRELHHGELSVWRRAVLPFAAALGGMLAPAAIYLLIAGGPPTRSGWGVPMATDIAFAVGLLALLGKRVPAALRVLLLALAVIDDLGAIVVIALFYSSGVQALGLLVAALSLGVIFAMQRAAIRSKAAYIAPALVTWGGVYAAGVHPTIAGVLVGLVTPVRAWLGAEGFANSLRNELEQLSDPSTASPHELQTSLHHVDNARREALSPAASLIESLHPWVAFGIMPLFALANAGVSVSGPAASEHTLPVTLAVAVGLFAGKPIGVLLACWLALRSGLASLPGGITFRHLSVLGVVASVGFTMALFVAQLAFVDPALLAAAKIGVLSGSVAAGVCGLLLGRALLAPSSARGVALTADEAEASTEA
ncbi:MAG: Na+/H+ antiporter NhaA [Polyangiaceae bacterium]